MARVSSLVCDKCGEEQVSAAMRITEGSVSFVADLCHACARAIQDVVPSGRKQAKRGRPKKS